MKKILIIGFLLAGFFESNAQTLRAVTTGSITTSTTGGTGINGSLNIGTGAGNTNATNIGAANIFIGNNSGKLNSTGTRNSFLGNSSGSNNLIGFDNSFFGYYSGLNNKTNYNSFFGSFSGHYTTTGSYNSFFGYRSGYTNSTGGGNSFFGTEAGSNNTTGQLNCFFGSQSGQSNTTSYENSFFGTATGVVNSTGSGNTFIGSQSGFSNTTGSGNVCLGQSAGDGNSTGNFNVFLGTEAGYTETGSNKLYIANTATTSPLILGDFGTSQLKLHGKVGVGGNISTAFGTIPTSTSGTSVANYNLFVKGGILTEEIIVSLSSTWADYVFAKDYKLKPLSELETYISKNKHLPNLPSADQIKEEGINVGEMARIQQEKIEELTLYIIEQNKRIEALEAKMKLK